MAKKTKQPKVGRPLGRKPLLNLRIEPSLHDSLRRAAVVSGRTVSEEAVRHIDLGLQSTTLLEQAINLAFGQEITGDLMMIGHIMRDAATRAGGIADWTEDPEMFDQVAKAVAAYFEERNPRGGMIPNEGRN
jgi:hypothetical protein